MYSQEQPLLVEVASTRANLANQNKVTAKMSKIMDSAEQIEAFIDGQMVTSDSSASSRSEGDGDGNEGPARMSRAGEDTPAGGGDFGKVIKDSSNVTGPRKLKSRYNHTNKAAPTKSSSTRKDLSNIDIRLPMRTTSSKWGWQPSKRSLLAPTGGKASTRKVKHVGTVPD